MNTTAQQKGLSLLVLLVTIALGGFALTHLYHSGHMQHRLQLQQLARQGQILNHIRSGLLGFAAQQGIHTQSQLGHMPCPANQPDQDPETTCLEKPWGYLPTHSKIAINYLNAGINARENELEKSAQHEWQYAVSSQLIQANALGWSRWVDFSKPGIRIQIPAESNRIDDGIVAVVAKAISAIDKHHYEVTPPYLLIRESELKTHMTRVQIHLIKETLNTWIRSVPTVGNETISNENLQRISQIPEVYEAINSNCSCRCTKTRCSCSCESNGNWKSDSICVGQNANCVDEETMSRCTSSAGEPCIFSGPAALQSDWPVSRFEPVAASNKSCRPVFRNQCPLSAGTEACTCDFSWPDNTKNKLQDFTLKRTSRSEFQVREKSS